MTKRTGREPPVDNLPLLLPPRPLVHSVLREAGTWNTIPSHQGQACSRAAPDGVCPQVSDFTRRVIQYEEAAYAGFRGCHRPLYVFHVVCPGRSRLRQADGQEGNEEGREGREEGCQERKEDGKEREEGRHEEGRYEERRHEVVVCRSDRQCLGLRRGIFLRPENGTECLKSRN